MSNKLIIFVAGVAFIPSRMYAQDSISVNYDSLNTSQSVHSGPLGISDTTGVAMYVLAIVFLILVLALWRRILSASNS